MSPGPKAQSASLVDPESIQARSAISRGAELLVRRRPPGGVELDHGQREHMLMSSVGKPVEDSSVRSVLTTERGRHEWQSCPQGHITYVPAGFPMTWSWSYESESTHLIIPSSFMADVGAELDGIDSESGLTPMFRVLDTKLVGLLRALRVEVADGHLGKDLVTSSLLTQIAVHLHRQSQPANGGPGPAVRRQRGGFSATEFQRCAEILHDRLDEKIPLAELAGEFGLSPFYFARAFKRASGFPPHEYQLQLRIERARALLMKDATKTIAEIAAELGFADESHFRRHFRRIVGTTPGQFRKQQ